MIRTRNQRGVALVITLIFLAVITILAVAFLALTRRGRTAEKESASRTVADQMADIGLERAKGEILADILGQSNLLGPQLMVSANYINPAQTMTNLLYDPRPPVLVDTNRSGQSGPLDFRFYVDLNRNNQFEDTGFIQVTNEYGNPVKDANGLDVFEYAVGDPQWIGVLSYPNASHNATNDFLGRYAFLVVPAGLDLDVNYIYNTVKSRYSTALNNNGFFRNQGVGPWEINLSALLTDLNTNYWGIYNYNPDLGLPSSGLGFRDAGDLLRFRYMGDSSQLPSFSELYPGAGPFVAGDFIDNYSDSPPVPLGGQAAVDDDDPSLPWPGAAGNTNLFTVHDFFGDAPGASFGPFVTRLTRASEGVSTYDRYTFYRMLGQLGTDSGPEPKEKINLNYVAGVTNLVGQRVAATNFLRWNDRSPAFANAFGRTGPELFFQVTADRLLHKEILDPPFTNAWRNQALSIWEQGGIPVYLNSSTRFLNTNGYSQRLYSQRVHQLLQIVANTYTATQGSKDGESAPYFPTVFQPVLEKRGNDVYISRYIEVNGEDFYNRMPFKGGLIKYWVLDDPSSRPANGFTTNDLAYGVPLIVGARKGFPNFNEFAMQSAVQASRKLEVRKNSPFGRLTETNQMFIMGISNVFGLEAWYPYTNGYPNNVYPRPLELFTAVSSTTTLTNSAGYSGRETQATNHFLSYNANTWGGSQYPSVTNHFRLPPITSQMVLTDSVYYLTPTPHFEAVGYTNQFERNVGVFTNLWGLTLTNRLIFFLFDRDKAYGTHIVDAVSLDGLDTFLDVSQALTEPAGASAVLNDMWNITPYRNLTQGARNQIQVSLGNIGTPNEWIPYGGFNTASGDTVAKAIASFRQFMGLPEDTRYPTNDLVPVPMVHQVPFTPTRKIVQTTSWQANDPLVHYTIDDLRSVTNNSNVEVILPPSASFSLTRQKNLGKINDRYRPWGGKNQDPTVVPLGEDVNPATRDPGLWNPDQFDFPTQPFPNIGWMGRVHRGTPWQTIYLKSDPATQSDWLRNGGSGTDMTLHPTNDWRLLDEFTVALDDRMTHGRLSINQTNLAAWSAVLAGVPVSTLREDANGNIFADDVLVQPAAQNFPVQAIVAGITRTRSQRADHQFTCLGDVLAVPELTSRSPFLEEPFISTAAAMQKNRALTDRDYERIPQEILSLLKVGEPRFVVYAFGQSLIPADVARSGAFFGMPTNYRITSEVATRAVVRVVYERKSTNERDRTYNEFDYEKPHLEVESFNILPAY
jgi:hypothetical protein